MKMATKTCVMDAFSWRSLLRSARRAHHSPSRSQRFRTCCRSLAWSIRWLRLGRLLVSCCHLTIGEMTLYYGFGDSGWLSDRVSKYDEPEPLIEWSRGTLGPSRPSHWICPYFDSPGGHTKNPDRYPHHNQVSGHLTRPLFDNRTSNIVYK